MSNNISVDSSGNSIAVQIAGIAPKWGNISGTLSDQIDLQLELNDKMGLILRGGLDGIGTTGSPLVIDAFKVVKTVADIAEFKTGSVYNLPADQYLFTEDINFGTDSINLDEQNGTYVFTSSHFHLLTYTGTTPFITSNKTGTSLDVIRTFLTTATATCIKLSTGNSLILEFPVFVNCKTCVDLDGMAFCTCDKLAMVACENGLILKDVGTASVQVGQWSSGQNLSGIAFDLSGAASERFFMTSSDSRPTATESFINIQSDYGGLVDLVAGVHTIGGGDFFKTSAPASRNQNDNDVSVTAIQNVTSSKSIASIHITPGDETETSIILNSEVIIAGTYTEDISQRFTTTGARVTYTGNEDRVFNFQLKTLGTPSSGNNKNYDFYIRKNGTTLIPISFDTINSDAGTPAKVICIGQVELSTTDFLEPIVIGRATSPTNLTCTGLAFIVTS